MGAETYSMTMEVDNKPSDKKTYKLNVISFRRLCRIIKTLFTGKRSDSVLLFILLILLCVGQQFIIYQIGLIPSHFFKVLGNKNRTAFKPLLVKAFSLILLIALCNTTIKVTCGHLYVIWREILTNHIQKKYFSSSAILYHVNILQNDIDNVDQRIGQDVERFCDQLRELAPKLVISPFTIIYYSVQCFVASGYIGPLVIYVYFLVGVIANKLIMSSIVTLVFKQEICEGDFRYWHTVIRSYAESIAFLRGERIEFKKVTDFFLKLLQVQRRIINTEMFLNFSTNLFDYIGSILSYIIISVAIFAGKYDNLSPVDLTSLISKNAFVSIYLISCFSTLIDLSTKFTDIFAYAHRIGELDEYLKFHGDIFQQSDENEEEKTKVVDDNQLLSITEMSYSAINSTNDLVNNLNLIVWKNRNLLIIGKTGSGKSSLLRILLDIWKPNKGNVQMNIKPNQIFFLPQKVFLTDGSLIEQVIYPLSKHDPIDYERAESILVELGLQSVILRCGGLDNQPNWCWVDNLSPGEAQRLSFARVCYHAPLLALLDEPTSGLGEDEEGLLYKSCEQRGITCLTVGHSESLKQYHQECLEIKGEGKWVLYDL